MIADSNDQEEVVYVFVGTKAQLIKMAPVVRALQEKSLNVSIVTTGQHVDTVAEMRQQFNLPEFDLMIPSKGDVTTVWHAASWFLRLLVVALFRPGRVFSRPGGAVLVHGDTLSTLIGAIAARRAGKRVGHVESGLRSESFIQPFPEEIIRRLVFRCCQVLYCPNEWAAGNVAHLSKEVVLTSGNTMIDAVRFARENLSALAESADTPAEPSNTFALITAHRFENIFNEKRLKKIVALVELVAERGEVDFVLHKPTEQQLRKYSLYDRLSNNVRVNLVPREPHFEFLKKISNVSCVLSDGGSIQEETSYLGVPCFLLRDYSERQEGLGSNVVIGGFEADVLQEFLDNLEARQGKPLEGATSPSALIAAHVAQTLAGRAHR